MEVLAPILEATSTTEEVGVSIPASETVGVETAKEPPVVSSGAVGVEEMVELTPVPISQTAITGRQ